ncbi:FAD-binding oxidoreductase [Nonlabens agnitus]|uniref:Flavodoxin reductase n=1 Tax=Nonlabens agnitus TaxID=870484 RepID=A0A2S9WXP5_9FLAO|nr:FAD-binding oxidoreductase [Nonlabens agnitus]PRP68252.1 flavodoxin reductase [Nonlabens agnitus]
MAHSVKIKSIKQLTHDVKQFRVEKPNGYEFTPGHATEVSIDQEKWKDEKRPFTFTSLTGDEDLEFVIKIYTDHDGVTEALDHVKPGDHLIIRDTWGAIEYKGDGYVIAGGAGITPYIAMFRDLKTKNKLDGLHLLFSNKTEKDIILKDELDQMLGDRVTYVITDQKDTQYLKGRVDKELIKNQVDDFDKNFYVCGPPQMTEDISDILKECGASPDAVTLDDQ